MYDLLNRLLSIPLVSVLVGGGITWLVARFYYKKAGDELKAEASRLRRQTEIILRWLEARGEDVSVIRTPDGEPMGLAHKANIIEAAEAYEEVVETDERSGPDERSKGEGSCRRPC